MSIQFNQESMEIIFLHTTVQGTSFPENFVLDSPAPGFYGGKYFIQQTAVATRLTIINLDICLKDVAAREYCNNSLTVRLNCSISGTCSFLDAKFRDMPISFISARSGSNLISVCIHVFLKTCCRYSLLNYLILSSMFFTFLFLIILTVVKIICRDILFRKPMPFMCMRSHHRVTFLYLSRMPLGGFGTMIGST